MFHEKQLSGEFLNSIYCYWIISCDISLNFISKVFRELYLVQLILSIIFIISMFKKYTMLFIAFFKQNQADNVKQFHNSGKSRRNRILITK